jgi:uncharacterized protein YyaL (SSP411 family)
VSTATPHSGGPFRGFAIAVVALTFAVPGLAQAPTALEVQEAALIQRLSGLVASTYDPDKGGFVAGGMPIASDIDLAWRLARDGQPEWRDRARLAVNWTWTLYDSVGGGFLQSTKDTRADFASFEKHTDSNARRLENRIDAWLDSKSSDDRHACRALLDFFDRMLMRPKGGFVSGQGGDQLLVPVDNGYAIHAYFCWGAATGETKWRDFGFKSLDEVWTSCWDPNLGMLRRGDFGDVTSPPRLEDQVEMGRAYVLGTHVGGREVDLNHARAIGELLLNNFEDDKHGGMRDQAVVDKDGKIKNASRDAGQNARAALFLAELASITGDGKYREAARRTVASFESDLDRPSPDCADWAMALRAIAKPDLPDRVEWQKADSTVTRRQTIVFPARKRYGTKPVTAARP